jgi:hypothetical protein
LCVCDILIIEGRENMKDYIGNLVYRIAERLSGQGCMRHSHRFISYCMAERVKVFCLVYLIA